MPALQPYDGESLLVDVVKMQLQNVAKAKGIAFCITELINSSQLLCWPCNVCFASQSSFENSMKFSFFRTFRMLPPYSSDRCTRSLW